ncbi:MAG: DoxX family protein [Patescibacteria group bacterium]
MNLQLKTAEYAPSVLRFGLVFLFLWFGISQILNPNSWTAWVPEWGTSVLGLDAVKVVLINGWFETVGGIFLAIGFWTRWIALVLSLHLLFIAYEVGYNDIGVRDFTLAASSLALSFFGPDKYTLDSRSV